MSCTTHTIRRLLTPGSNNPKTAKGEALLWRTMVLHLAPADLSGRNVCPWSTEGCRTSCLNTAGRGGIMRRGETTNAIQQARLRRTHAFFTDRAGFLAQLEYEVISAEERASHPWRLAVRLNGTSDLPWHHWGMMRRRSNVQFYDYTKDADRCRHWADGALPSNYHLTFSRSETTSDDTVRGMVNLGVNVAVVFDRVPDTYLGIEVIDGDANDLRFLDPKGVIVGLKAKGRAKRDTTGFVVRTGPEGWREVTA